MGRPRNSPSMTDGKREIISRLIEEYDIKTAEDIQDALRDLLGGTIQGMMECEMEAQKEEHQASDPEYHDSRNGYKPDWFCQYQLTRILQELTNASLLNQPAATLAASR